MVKERQNQNSEDEALETAGAVEAMDAPEAPDAAEPAEADSGVEAEAPSVEAEGETGGGESAETEADGLAAQLEEANRKADEFKDRWQRGAAEFDNYKKRTAREKEALYQDAAADVIGAFLPVVDSIERACQAADAAGGDGAEASSVREGLLLIQKQARDVLAKLGVEALPGVGEPFDPNVHNAVMHVEDEALEKNVVAEEFQRGFKYRDRIVRHSMVKVAN